MALANQEEAVLATFDFLRDPGDIDDEGDMSDEEEGADADVEADDTLLGEGGGGGRGMPLQMELSNECVYDDFGSRIY